MTGTPDAFEGFERRLAAIRTRIEVAAPDPDRVTLMAVGVPGPPEGSRAGFREVTRLADALALPVRSMGMTDDLEVALSEGSTLVRIGRALFGDRPPRA